MKVKNTTLLLAAACIVALGARASAQGEDVLIGELGVQDLLMLPGWFGDDYRSYTPSRSYLDGLREQMEGVNIVCLLGTWCSDSKREVPRMIKLIQVLRLPPETFSLIGLDREKRGPGGEEKKYNVELVPTFIVFRDGVEIGRIVERPYGPLEKDLLGILDPQPVTTPAELGVDDAGALPPPPGGDMHNLPEGQHRTIDPHHTPPRTPPPPPGEAKAPQESR